MDPLQRHLVDKTNGIISLDVAGVRYPFHPLYGS